MIEYANILIERREAEHAMIMEARQRRERRRFNVPDIEESKNQILSNIQVQEINECRKHLKLLKKNNPMADRRLRDQANTSALNSTNAPLAN